MRTYALSELFNLTRAELFALHRQLTEELDRSGDHCQRHFLLGALQQIRRVLARSGPSP